MAEIIGDSGLIFGTIGDSEIIVTNLRESHQGEWEDLPDGQGRIVAFAAHGTKGEVSMDFVIRDGTAASYLLSRGAEINLPTGETDVAAGRTLYLVDWERTKTRNDWYQGTLQAVYSPDVS